MDRRTRIPKYRHHKSTNRALVAIDGRDIYLGTYDSPASHREYKRIIAEWLANGEPRLPNQRDDSLIVVEMCRSYHRYAAQYYRDSSGDRTSTFFMVKVTLRRLRRLYGRTPVSAFGPLSLQAIRQSWIADGLSRTTVNMYTSAVTRIFRWGASQQMVPETVYRTLALVPGLTADRSGARETEPKRPVPTAHIDAVRPHVSRQVEAVMDLQLLCAARGGELLKLRPVDLDTSGPVWVAILDAHKTAHRGREKVLFFGPAAQHILAQFMAGRPVGACMFTPREAEAERYAKAPTHRHQPVPPSRTGRRVSDHYTAAKLPP